MTTTPTTPAEPAGTNLATAGQSIGAGPAAPLLKKKPLARALGISPRTLDTLVAKRVIPYLALSPRLHLFDPEAVRKALANRFEVRTQ